MKADKLFLFFGVIFAASVLVGLTGCSDDATGPVGGTTNDTDNRVPIPGAPEGAWRATAEADGWARSDDPDADEYAEGDDPISVTVTLTNGLISAVAITGQHETWEWGGAILHHSPALIIARNAFNLTVADGLALPDTMSAASYTVRGINEAGNAAIAIIVGNGGEQVNN